MNGLNQNVQELEDTLAEFLEGMRTPEHAR
jgi:hypothetical protein